MNFYKMIRSVILGCLFAALVKGQSTTVSQCTMNGGHLPLNAYIESCARPPCLLPQKQDAVINFTFRTPYMIKEMRTLASAYVFTIPVHYDLQENGLTCNFLTNASCPVLAGQIVRHTLKIYIEPIFPLATFTMEFRVVDDDNVPFVCIRLPVTIAAPVEAENNNKTLTATV